MKLYRCIYFALSPFVAFLILTPAYAADQASKSLGVDIGFGLQSNYGLFGAGVRYFTTDSIDLHVTTGCWILRCTR